MTPHPITKPSSSREHPLNRSMKIPSSLGKQSRVSTLSRTSVFPSDNLGYPSGAILSGTGGRTADDTQVSTLGVPLNAAQGGGADFSAFPSFLWSDVETSPQGVSGNIQFKLWTRETLASLPTQSTRSQFTSSYRRDVQSFSFSTKQENMAVTAGLNTGELEGPAGALSYSLIREPVRHLMFHIIATSDDGVNPGSITFPTPHAHKKMWRVIPVLEFHQEFNETLTLETTAFSDLQELQFTDPANPLYSSDDRIQQYGIENAVLLNPYTFGLSCRSVHYVSSTFHELKEWPLESRLSRDFNLSDLSAAKLTATANYLDTVGTYPGAKAAIKVARTPKQYYFGELNTTPKMPTLINRYYQISGYFNGNPALKPERVNALIFGFTGDLGKFQTTTTAKAEYRNQIQVNQNQTVVNAGNASLLYLTEECTYIFMDALKLTTGTLLSYSRLQDQALPYPDLPTFSQTVQLIFNPSDRMELNLLGKYVGPSTAAGGRFHPNYTLIDWGGRYHFNQNYALSMGIDNIFDDRAQVVLDYPLPGRIGYLALQASF